VSLYCKVDCMLDSNPKIRMAGRNGREVFLFVLRRNRALDGGEVGGQIPASNIAPQYLADQLMMTEEDARNGVVTCVTHGLLHVTDTFCTIVGWGDEWGRETKTGAQRVAAHRARVKNNKNLDEDVTDVTLQPLHVTQEKKREEKRREELPVARKARATSQPSGDYQVTVADFTAHYQTAYATDPTWNGRTGKLLSALVKAHGGEEVRRRIGVLFNSPPAWIKPPFDVPTLSVHFDKLAEASTSGSALDVGMRELRRLEQEARDRGEVVTEGEWQ